MGLSPEQQATLKAIEKSISKGKRPSRLSVYHNPGTIIKAKDGTEYEVQANGSWLKIKEKNRDKPNKNKDNPNTK